MKRIIVVAALLAVSIPATGAEYLDEDKQLEIIQQYLHATGQRELISTLSLEDGLPDETVKCGTPAVLNFVVNRDKLDPALLKSLGVQTEPRPTDLDQSLLSPSGVFRIHYTTSGADRVYTGFDGYADSVAAIYDEVYDFMVNTLGYPPPPSDGFYPSGDGPEFDVYLMDLEGQYYGLTYLDSVYVDGINSTNATAFQILDNDYQEIDLYRNDPLRAVRVTCAHEFFHVVQFGIDFTELEIGGDGLWHSFWMEMSATWMEEVIYDDINDYYYYLPSFFADPRLSLEQYRNSFDLHPYGSVVWPLFVSERFDRDLIRDMWFKCADLGQGSHFLLAADQVIDSATGGQESFASTFNEFAVWNYYTGPRSVQAPDGYGYSERFGWGDDIWFTEVPPDPVITVLNSYEDTISVSGYENLFNPDHNAAFYLKLNELRLIKPDTTYWDCNVGSFPTCTDSSQVSLPESGYDVMHIDSTLTVGLTLAIQFPYDWGFSTIYQFEDDLDSTEVVQSTMDRGAIDTLEYNFSEISDWRSITYVLTPASSDSLLYDPQFVFDYDIGYSLSAELSIIDSAMMNLPAAVLAPYPNPVVVSELINDVMTFKFQVPTDTLGFPIYGEAYSGTDPSLTIDIFSVAGDHVCTLDETSDSDALFGTYWIEWDLRNSGGKDVSSGVYVAYARLYESPDRDVVLAEEKTKIVVIR